MTIEHVSLGLLAVVLLVMAGINVFALMKLMPLIDSEDKGIHDVKGSVEQIQTLLTRLISKLESMATTSTSAPDDAAWVDKYDAPFQEISGDALDGVDDSMAAAESLLGELDGLQAEDWSAWRDAHQLQLRSLLKMHDSQRRRLAQLRLELDQARGMLLNLRSGASRPVQGAVQAAALQARNTAIESELWSVKAERGRLLKDLAQAQKELATLQAGQASVEAAALDGADSSEWQERYATLESRLNDLSADNARLQAQHDRTLLEKAFIEEAFLRMDAELGLGVPKTQGATQGAT